MIPIRIDIGGRVISLANRTEVLNMRVGETKRCVAPTVLIASKGKGDEDRALGEREHATRPAAPR
eukprot:2650607-Pleurochrysis_carterae.AAC.1